MLNRRFIPGSGRLVLAFCTAAILLQRIHTYREPLENDIAGYAVIGHEMLAGRHLYSDLWERKPPLLYGTFAVAECLAGYGRGEIFLVNLSAALLTLMALYIAGASGPSDGHGGSIAAVCWTLLCGDLFMQANQPNAEVLLNFWLTAAFALLLRWPLRCTPFAAAATPASPAGFPQENDESGVETMKAPRQFNRYTVAAFFRQWGAAAVLGVLFAGATLIKHHVLVTCLALAVGFIVFSRSSSLRRRAIEMSVSMTLLAGIWGLMFGYFAAVGRLHPMMDVLFHQNSIYAGRLLFNLMDSLTPGKLFRPFLTWMVCPLAILIVFAFFALKQKQPRRFLEPQWKLWLAWAAGTWPAVVLPGHLFPHYYQLWVPVWCVATGWAGAGILDRTLMIPNVVRFGTIAAALTVLACRELTPYSLTPDQWAEQKYRGGNYVQQQRLGEYLGQSLLKPTEQFWVLGDDNSLYFAAEKSPPSGLLYVDPLVDGDETEAYNQRLTADLSRSKPVLVILSPLAQRLRTDAPVFDWLRKNYTLWNTALGKPTYFMFVRNGSDLATR